MSWLQTITIIVSIIGVLGGLVFALHNATRREHNATRREIDALRTDMNNQLNEIRKDIRMLFDKIIPPYSK